MCERECVSERERRGKLHPPLPCSPGSECVVRVRERVRERECVSEREREIVCVCERERVSE